MAQHVELLDDGHPFRQWRTWRLPGSGLTLTGYSRSNDKTFFHVPELRGARLDNVVLWASPDSHLPQPYLRQGG